MRFFRTLSRSVSVAAAFAAAVALLPTAAHAAGGVLVVSHQPYGTPVLDMGDVDMGTTGVGQQTEVVLVVGNTGDEEIEITSVSVSAGFNIESSVTGPLFPDFTKALRISCDATEATPGSDPLVGTVGITSTNPGDSLFVVHLWCRVVGGAQNGTLAVADHGGNPIPEGGVLQMDPGASSLVWLSNVGEGQQSITLLPVVADPAGPIAGQYVDHNVLAHLGEPVYFSLACVNAQEQPISGAFLIKIPMKETESYFTFSLHCGVVEAAATEAEMPHTGPAGAAWSGAIAVLLLAAGWGFLVVSRRRTVI